jgi:hypothetical protein
MVWFIRQANGICIKKFVLTEQGNTSEITQSDGGKIIISGSVGIYGYNYPEDTNKIQDALNQVPAEQGGVSPKLKVDSKCGPKTKQAIQNFQLKHFGWKGADGLIDPGKQTLAKLNEILGRTAAPAKLPNPVPASVIQSALSMVKAAQTNLLAASLVLDENKIAATSLPSFSRETRMHLLNKHFSVDQARSRRHAFDTIKNKYDRMLQIFMHPGFLWGSAIFQSDPLNLLAHAYTYSGGYFKQGQTQYYRGVKVRLDSVYLCEKFYTHLDHSGQSFAIVHELAHFVGMHDEIDDYAYNRGSGAKVRSLSADLKYLNAECYANFAYEAKNGQEPWRFP